MANYISKDMREMQEGEKRKITPKSIHKSLVAMEKVNFIGWLIASAALLMVSGMIAFGLSLDGFSDEKLNNTVKILLLAAPFLMALVVVICYCYRMKTFSSRRYTVITDTVQRVVTDDRLVVRHRGGRRVMRTEHAMYLYRCGRVVISLEETYINSEGDVYYVVVDVKKPNDAIFLYNSKFYELEDVEMSS